MAAQPATGSAPEATDMALVGSHDLQGRSAYQPIIQQQGGRFIAYIGHHGGSALNYIRDYGVVGQEPGSSGEPAPLHGPIRLGNRVYFGYGTSAGGILQIVDHDKLLHGDPTAPDPFAPTASIVPIPGCISWS